MYLRVLHGALLKVTKNESRNKVMVLVPVCCFARFFLFFLEGITGVDGWLGGNLQDQTLAAKAVSTANSPVTGWVAQAATP